MRASVSPGFFPLLCLSLVAGQAPLPKAPLAFEPNRGQAPAYVKFLARGGGETLGLTDRGMVLGLRSGGRQAFLGFDFLGAAAHPRESAEEPLPGRLNYLLGERSEWRTGIPTSAKVRYRGVYPGTDLVYYGRDGRLEYDWVLRPGADPNRIRLGLKGAGSLGLAPDGSLLVKLKAGEFKQAPPVIYQLAEDGSREKVEGRFRLLGGRRVGFELGAYDRGRELVIDPSLSWSTYFGGNADTRIEGVKMDSAGNVYVAGVASSCTTFPTTAGAYSAGTGIADNSIGFVSKFAPDGQTLLWSTVVGSKASGKNTQFFGLALDSTNQPVVVGGADSSFGAFTTSGAYQTSSNVGTGVIVAKLNASGTGIVFATYVAGGSTGNSSEATGVALDGSDNVYGIGFTNDSGYPTHNGYQASIPSAHPYDSAIFFKLSANGSTLAYSSFLGGNGGYNTMGNKVAVDPSGMAYLTGSTDITNFPTTAGAYQTSASHAWLTKLDPTKSGAASLVYSTYILGGGSDASGEAILVDPYGFAYVGGYTADASGNELGTVLKMNDTGTSASYVTSFDSPSDHAGGNVVYFSVTGLAQDPAGRIWFAGQAGFVPHYTQLHPLPHLSGNDPDDLNNPDFGTISSWVGELDTNGTPLMSTLFGSSVAGDTAYGIATDPAGDVAVVGELFRSPGTYATPFTTYHGLYTTNPAPSNDAAGYILKIAPPVAGTPTLSGGQRGTLTLNGTATDDTGVASRSFLVDGSVVATASGASGSTTFDSTSIADGSHTFSMQAKDVLGNPSGYAAGSSFTTDNTAPTVSASVPNGGPSNTLSANAVDNLTGIDHVNFYLDGSFAGSKSAPGFKPGGLQPLSSSIYTLAVAGLADGPHNMYAQAVDGAGNTGTSTTIPFTADATGPSIGGTSVVGQKGSITLTATGVTDPSGVDHVNFLVDGNLVGSQTTPSVRVGGKLRPQSVPSYHLAFDSTTIADGGHSFKVSAVDIYGNTSNSGTSSFTTDNTAPTGGFDVLQNNVSVNNQTVSGVVVLSATPADPTSGIQRVTFYVDGAYYASVYAAPYTANLDTAKLVNGPHTLLAYSVDNAGNIAYTTPEHTYITSSNADTIPPTGSTTVIGTSGTITFSTTASDASGIARVTYYVDGHFYKSVTTAPYSASIDSTTLTNGTHYVLTYGVDNAGNIGYFDHGKAFTVSN